MTTNDRIVTPFTAGSTADEVSEGIDLTGQRAIVTGGAAGIGIETAETLARRGAAVTRAIQERTGAIATPLQRHVDGRVATPVERQKTTQQGASTRVLLAATSPFCWRASAVATSTTPRRP